MPDRVKPSFLTSGHSGAQGWTSECQDVKNSQMTGLTRSGTGCFLAVLYPYGNSRRQRVNVDPLMHRCCWLMHGRCFCDNDVVDVADTDVAAAAATDRPIIVIICRSAPTHSSITAPATTTADDRRRRPDAAQHWPDARRRHGTIRCFTLFFYSPVQVNRPSASQATQPCWWRKRVPSSSRHNWRDAAWGQWSL